MIAAVELAKEAKINVFIYFPPHQYSSNLATMGNGAPIQMLRYEKRFKQVLLPDKITLANGFELSPFQRNGRFYKEEENNTHLYSKQDRDTVFCNN
jgi:hypothetical protein